MNPQAPAAPATPPALDQDVVNLAKALRSVETKGQKDPYTAKGASGEFGAYQYTKDTWAADSKAFLGKDVPLEQADKVTQNEVAYKKILSLKKQGYNPGQIASIWNSGSPEWEGKVGVNKYNVKYDVPKYVDAVATAYQGIKAGSNDPMLKPTASTVGQEEIVSDAQMKDTASAQQHGAFFPAATGDSPLAAGLKTAGNVLPSAFNFAKGAIKTLNPIETVKTLSQIPAEFNALVQEQGLGKALQLFGSSLPKEAYEMLVPEAGRELIGAGKGAITGDQRAVDEGLQNAQRAITNDPIGQVAPFFIGAKMGAKALDTTGITKAAEANLDAGVSKVARPAIDATKYAFGAPGRVLSGTAGYATAKLSGLNKDTLSTIAENPKDFTPEAMANMSRQSLGENVGSKLTERIDSLDDAGAGYGTVREAKTPIKVDPNFLADTLAANTGLVLKKGKFTPTAKSPVDSPTDIAKVQRLYDAWQPYFKKGTMTADDFLTLRSKLAGIANYEGIGKSKPLDAAASRTRGALNTKYRTQIEGLEDLDANFSSMSTELKALRKGLIDKDGHLLDTAINRIANAAGKGKDAQLARLEEISPGIGLKIRQLKAVEDIQNIHKVGTYAKATLEGGGLVGGVVTGNIALIAASVVSLLLSQPEVAVRIIRTYGKSRELAQAVLKQLGKVTAPVNNLPETGGVSIGAFTKKVRELAQ